MKEGIAKGVVIVGTDTGVGKTRFTCWLARALAEQGIRVGVCKPAVTGGWQRTDGTWAWDDLLELQAACPLDVPQEWICPHRWITPLSPPMAAEVDAANGFSSFPGESLRLPKVADYVQSLDVWRESCDFLIVEGIGGLLCPLTERETFVDLAQSLGLPMVLVAHLGLGTINHTLLTVSAAEAAGLKIACIVLNRTRPDPDGIAEQTNRKALMQRLDIPVLEPLPYQGTVEPVPTAVLQEDWLSRLAAV